MDGRPLPYRAGVPSTAGWTGVLASSRRFAPLDIKSVTFDCADPIALATFWAAALGSNVDEDSTAEQAFVQAPGWGGPNIWFNKVPEPKTAKNRVHFDLRAPDTIDAEVARLEALGATVTRRGEDIVVMIDVEGNEFCVE